MVTRVLVTIVLIGFLGVVGNLAWKHTKTNAGDCALSVSFEKTISLRDTFYDAQNFGSALQSVNKIKRDQNVRAIIVPHHLLASTLIAHPMQLSSGRSISRVYVVGPNHWNTGPNAIATMRGAWQTPGCPVVTDNDAIGRLTSATTVGINQAIFVQEHSVGAMMPFISHYFPRAQVVPIVLSSYAGISESEKLGAWLAKEQKDDTLVIFSIDFSHYLPEEIAEQKDVITRRLILARDIQAISHLGNDNVDSPASLMTALVLAREMGLKTQLVGYGNANDFLPLKAPSTTSYFAIAFTD